MSTTEKQAKTELASMKAASLPRLDWRTMVSSGADELSPEDSVALDEYFKQFIQLEIKEDAERKCPCCQSKFGKNGIVSFLMAGADGYATLEWGIANGEAACSKCGYPFRVYHRNVGPIKFLSVGLPYHPDELEAKAEAA